MRTLYLLSCWLRSYIPCVPRTKEGTFHEIPSDLPLLDRLLSLASLRRGNDDAVLGACDLLELVIGDEAGAASGVTHNDALFLPALHKGLRIGVGGQNGDDERN